MNSNEPLDPVVERTRAAREALARCCGYDIQKMMEFFKSRQAEHPERVKQPATPSRPRQPATGTT